MILAYLTITINLTDEEREKLKNDIWRARILNLVDPDEYFLYGFRTLDENERYMFVGNREKESLCAIINDRDVSNIFMDKWITFQHFSKFYGRTVIHIESCEDRQIFVNFVNEKKKVIIKSSKESQGRGIFAATDLTIEESWTIIETILNKGGAAVVEEFVNQTSEMSKFNPSSVNTIRIATFRNNNQVEIMFAFARFGRKGSIVDNGGRGGIFCSIDKKTGMLNPTGRDENGIWYQCHPDSGIGFDNVYIPQWDDVIRLAKELSGVVSQQVYVGWDLAYTENGWIMIEGNSWSQFIGPQTSLKQGMRNQINETFYKYINELFENE